MIFVSVQIYSISYVDANARNQIQGFHVTLLSVLHTQEWQSS